MEELELLVKMVANLPSMALWVIALFFAYKVCVVGSIYGVIRFVTAQVVAWLREKKALPVKEVEIRPVLDGMCISGTLESFIAQIKRVAGKRTRISTSYVHSCSVDWLREAIDDKIAKDASEEAKKAGEKK